jgi:hypothetical protein
MLMLMSLGSNMFTAGFADTELRRTIMSGMMGRSLAEDLAVVNNTLTAWSRRSVHVVPLSPPHHSHNHSTAQIWDLRMPLSY